jgi:hypothetical protein
MLFEKDYLLVENTQPIFNNWSSVEEEAAVSNLSITEPSGPIMITHFVLEIFFQQLAATRDRAG